jgi:hypothetical protein
MKMSSNNLYFQYKVVGSRSFEIISPKQLGTLYY